MIEIVAATRNRGKLREIAAALAGFPVRLASLDDYPGAPEVVEDGDTFAANAAKKARAIAVHTHQYALADDSGLAVDALGGAPGVFSARYAGENADDAANLKKLLVALAAVPAAPRSARFICVIALADPAGRLVLAEGRVEGEIIASPRGHNGFGYDPVFLYPPLGRSFAELTAPEKLAVSHRGRALRELAEKIRDLDPLARDATMGPVDRFRGCLLGLAAGDALGAPVEGLKSGHIKQLYGAINGYADPVVAWAEKPHRWRQPGLYTDDTQQALALADTLLKCRRFDPAYFARLLIGLARADAGGRFGAHRGTGRNFRATVLALQDGAAPDLAAQPTAGIGAMMRAAPCGLYFDDDDAIIRAAIEQGLVTHRDPRALVMAALAALAVARGASGAWDRTKPDARARELAQAAAPIERLLESAYIHRLSIAGLDRLGLTARAVGLLPRLLEMPAESMVFAQIVGEANRQFPEHKITEPGDGFVMAAGLSALFIAVAAGEYEDAVKRAVHLGKDTDTMAAVVGAVCGARFGEDAVPAVWRKKLINADQVARRGEALHERDAAGLGLQDLVAMETALTRAEATAREAFIARMQPKLEPRPARPQPAPAPPRAPEAPTPSARERKKKQQKPERVKAPWKR